MGLMASVSNASAEIRGIPLGVNLGDSKSEAFATIAPFVQSTDVFCFSNTGDAAELCPLRLADEPYYVYLFIDLRSKKVSKIRWNHPEWETSAGLNVATIENYPSVAEILTYYPNATNVQSEDLGYSGFLEFYASGLKGFSNHLCSYNCNRSAYLEIF